MTGLGAVAAADTAPGRTSLRRRVLHWLFGQPDDPRHVARLSDRDLRDIGLSRPQAHDLFARRGDPRF